MVEQSMEVWDLWYPKAGSTGLPFARGRVQGTTVMLVHAAPPFLTVTVRDDAGNLLAEGKDLETTCDTTIARLTRRGYSVDREYIWSCV